MANDFFKISKGLHLKGRATEPVNPVDGDIYYDTVLQQLRWYVFGAWTNLGGGSGDASSVITRLWDTLEDSIFNQVTGVDFSLDKDDHVDTINSTGLFVQASETFEFSAAAETLITTDNLLSTDEFITPGKALGKVQLVVFWAEGSVDTGATYEVKTTTGGYEEITMARVGDASETYQGTLDISSYTSPDNVQIRITSSAASAIAGYGLFYDVSGLFQAGDKFYQEVQFQSNSAPASFTLNWLADPELLDVKLKETGQSFSAASVGDDNGFTVTGSTVTFPAGVFDQDVDESFTLVFKQSTGTADTSSSNASKISNLSTSTEALGTKTASNDSADVDYVSVPFTTITGRAPIRDISKIPSPKMGIERIPFGKNGHELKSGEAGPTDDAIYGSADPYDRIRFIGNWQFLDDVNSVQARGDGLSFEVTFYGTGLNVLIKDSALTDLRATVDGGAESGNLTSAGSGVLETRGYPPNAITPVVSGLTEGLHTVRVRAVSGPGIFHGIEILNETAQLSIPAGDILAGDDRFSFGATSTDYNTGFDASSDPVGTRGGSVLVYGYKDPSTGVTDVRKRFNAVGSQLNLGSADHSNEEVTAKHHWRSFGAGRGDDFSTVPVDGVTSNRAFTLDDGITTLVGKDIYSADFIGPDIYGLVVSGPTDFITLTFVGTGLDVSLSTGGGATSEFNVYVDGSDIGDLPTVPNINKPQTFSVVSGLPYGTHTVKFEFGGSNSTNHVFYEFITYGPKKPELPANSTELGSYNLMADFDSSGATGGNIQDNVQVVQGTLKKYCIRELNYLGSWNASSVDVNSVCGFAISTATNTDKFKYSFYGEAVALQFIGSGGVQGTFTTKIDGVLNSTGVNIVGVNNDGGGTYTVTSGSAETKRLKFEGLGVGFHTIELEKTGNTIVQIVSIDVNTPIHVPKADRNLLRDDLIGSNSVKSEVALPDFRKGKVYFPDGVDLGASGYKWQKKQLTANITSNGFVEELSFHGLEVGKTYGVSFQGFVFDVGISELQVNLQSGSALDFNEIASGFYRSNSTNERQMMSFTSTFVAKTPNLLFHAVAGFNGSTYLTTTGTHLILTELPNHKETNEW